MPLERSRCDPARPRRYKSQTITEEPLCGSAHFTCDMKRPKNVTNISLKLCFSGDRALGPGKVRLLELIGQTGSISAASRAMVMSYPRAWKLVAELNAAFALPLVTTQIGGADRGGAIVTSTGREVVRRYRAIEARIYGGSAKQLAALGAALAK